MKKADLAMYHAKQARHDSYQFFKPEMNARAIERQSLEDTLHYAIERQELVLYYPVSYTHLDVYKRQHLHR